MSRLRATLAVWLVAVLALTLQLTLLSRPVVAQAPLAVRFTAVEPLGEAFPGVPFDVRVVAQNTGSVAWTDADQFHLSYHWLDAARQVIVWDGQRTRLPHNIAPGESLEAILSVAAPEKPGPLVLQVDLVQEGHAWFADLAGSEHLLVDVTIADVPFVAGLPPRLDQDFQIGRASCRVRV